MKLRPSKDESELPAAHIAVHDLEVVDLNLGFSFGMASMEVREAVIVKEHDDGDPEEAADRWHDQNHAPNIGGSSADQTFRPSVRLDTFLSMRTNPKRSPAATVMNKAIDLALEGRSSYPEHAAFVDADAPSAGQEIMHAASRELSIGSRRRERPHLEAKAGCRP
jgi:hypothetical protein